MLCSGKKKSCSTKNVLVDKSKSWVTRKMGGPTKSNLLSLAECISFYRYGLLLVDPDSFPNLLFCSQSQSTELGTSRESF